MINTPLALRWARAQRIVEQAIPLGYMVGVRMGEDAVLTGCTCTCPDYTNPDLRGMGEPTWRGIRVCKHTLALALSIHEHLYIDL